MDNIPQTSTTLLRSLGRYAHNQTEVGWQEPFSTLALHQADGKGGHTSKHTVVGLYQPNRWGLYDMHGNVSEWCLDWYTNRSSYTDVGIATMPIGRYRVRRGGSWNNLPMYCRSYFRDPSLANQANESFGFRLVIQEY